MCWPAIHIPETYGGLGLGFVELSILLEQMCRRLLCSPFVATACMATPALLRQMLPTMDQTRRQARVQLKSLYLSADCLLGEFGAGWPHLERVLQRACIGLAAEQTGGGSRCST